MKASATASSRGSTTSGSRRAPSASSPRSTGCCSRTARTSCSRATASSSPAAAGAGATSSTPVSGDVRRTTGGRSIRRPSQRACGRCSSAPTGRGAASGGGSSRRARPQRGRGLPPALARRDDARAAALPGVRLRAPRRRRRDDARRRRRSRASRWRSRSTSEPLGCRRPADARLGSRIADRLNVPERASTKRGFRPSAASGRSLEHVVSPPPSRWLRADAPNSRCSAQRGVRGRGRRVHVRAQRRRFGARSRSASTTTSSSRPGSPASRAGSSCGATGSPGSAMGTRRARLGDRQHVWTFTVADLADPPFPSIADIGFLAVYPPAYVAIVLLLRSRVQELRSSLWLDGVISGLAVGAVGTAVIFPAILDAVGGSSRAAVTTNLAYPLARPHADRHGRLGARRHRLAARPHVGPRRGRAARLLDQRLPLPLRDGRRHVRERLADRPRLGRGRRAARLGGLAAARRPSRARRSRAGSCSSRRSASACSACAVLLYDHCAPRQPALARAREPGDPRRDRPHGADLRREHADARALARGGAHRRPHRARQPPAPARSTSSSGSRRGDARLALALFDLNGFKQYNDAFGHPAGDALLGAPRPQPRALHHRGAARPTGWAATSSASCSRPGEPAGLRRSRAPSARCASTARASTSRASYGTVTLPDEATTSRRRSASPTSGCTRRRRPAA